VFNAKPLAEKEKLRLAKVREFVVNHPGRKDLSEGAQAENPSSTPGSDHFRAPEAPEQSA